MSGYRDELLAKLRRGAPGEAPPLPDVRVGADLPPDGLAMRFTEVLTRVGGHVARVADLDAAARHVASLLAENGAEALLLSDAPEALAVAARLPDTVRRVPHDAPREEQLLAGAGLATAQLGIAETGTLVLRSDQEQHRLATLLPDLSIVLLPRSRLCGSLGQAFAQLRLPDGGPAARTITFVTGPSRTADIELHIVVGVHGPKALHVLLLESP